MAQGEQRKRGIPTGISGLARNCRTERRKKRERKAEQEEVKEKQLVGEWKWTGARGRVRAQAWRA